MKHVKYLILGAGPAGLSFAHALQDAGENSFLLLERESVAGGLCRSVQVDGAPLDTGGGHFLDVKAKDVLDFIFRFLPLSEWSEYERISRILLNSTAIDYPLEANLWQLPLRLQIDYLESIARAGCVQAQQMPIDFREWIPWKLGTRIAEDYMFPYNQKLWSSDLSRLGTYWLHKLPNVSLRETLSSCLNRKAEGAIPAHGMFLYPKKYGYGEVWQRMGAALGERLLLDFTLDAIDIETLSVNGTFTADKIITSIPWPELNKVAHLPANMVNAIDKLESVSIAVDYHSRNFASNAHWIYEPDTALPYHRVLCRNNFIPGSRGYWTESNFKRVSVDHPVRFINKYAYPVPTINKPRIVKDISEWANSKHIIGIGRWGTWEHMNSDAVVASARASANGLVSL